MTSPSSRSYRDRHSGIRFEGQTVVRSFDEEGAGWFRAAHEAGLLRRLVDAGLVVDHAVRSLEPLEVEAPLLPGVTFPYEWTGSMLRDAGVVTLDIAAEAWDAGFHIRDASAFNIVFHDGRPRMVDLGSIRPGHTPYFLAYGQFCDHFLNPLAVAGTVGVSTRSIWSSLEGISAEEARMLMGWKALRPRFLRHIWARAGLERRTRSLAADDRRSIRSEYGLPPEAIRKSLGALRDLVARIEPRVDGAWRTYEADCSYGVADTEAKGQFVASVAAATGGRRALDVGANAGHFSALLAPHFESVVAIEPDESAAEILYRRVSDGAIPSNIVPMVADVVDLPGGRGLMNEERPSALGRLGRADLVVWLAVIHHLVLSSNVPLPLVFELALALGDRHVFEHVSPDDEMSRLLLSSRDEMPWPLDRETFESQLTERFSIVETCEITATRSLYEAVAR